MKITIVIDQFANISNATSHYAYNLVMRLRKDKHEVKVLTALGLKDNNTILLAPKQIALFDNAIKEEGCLFATPDESKIELAIKDAEVVYVLFPFELGRKTIEIAHSMNKKVVVYASVFGEEITYPISLSFLTFYSNSLNRKFFKQCYSLADALIVPSETMGKFITKKEDTKYSILAPGYTDLYVNKREEKPEEYKDKFVIISTSRLSKVKNQEVIIDGISRSKYKDKIRLILLGKGHNKKSIEELQMRLDAPIDIRFANENDLAKALRYADLYVDSAMYSSSADAVIKAMASGTPVIMNKSKTNASLDYSVGNDTFLENSFRELGKKIDECIENPKEFMEMKNAQYNKIKELTFENHYQKLLEIFKSLGGK